VPKSCHMGRKKNGRKAFPVTCPAGEKKSIAQVDAKWILGKGRGGESSPGSKGVGPEGRTTKICKGTSKGPRHH